MKDTVSPGRGLESCQLIERSIIKKFRKQLWRPFISAVRRYELIQAGDKITWSRYNQLEFIQCACRFTENCTICDNGGGGFKRQEIKILLRRLKRDNPNIEKSIFNSIHAVSLDTFPGYKQKGQEHSFLEHYTDMQ